MSRSNPHADTPSEQPASQALHGYTYAELKNPEVTGQTPLAEECAVAISYNGISHTVMMATPADIEDFVAGLSLSAGIIHSIDDIYGMQVRRVGEALNVEVEISSRTFWALKSQRRQMAGTSGCGLCGVEALEQALPQLDRLRKVQLPPAEHLANLRQRINERDLSLSTALAQLSAEQDAGTNQSKAIQELQSALAVWPVPPDMDVPAIER